MNLDKTKPLELYGLECPETNCNIIIIDDDKEFNDLLKKALILDKHEVTQAFSLKEAESYFEDKKYDYVILNLKLSDNEDDELIESLPKKLKSKMIILATDEDVQRREYLFSLGILDYFFKDTPLPLMITNIRELICKVELNHLSSILIVDESSFARKVLRTILRRRGYVTFEAQNAKDCLEILKTQKIHLLLLAYELPDLDGISVLENIKKDDNFLELPVIMLSAHDDKDIVSRALKLGAIDFIRKPFINEELLLKCDFHTKNYALTGHTKEQERKLEETIKKMKKIEEHKSQFLANMSHEIRTPLNAIMGFIELLKDENFGRKSLDYVHIIDESSKNLLQIINDILDFSKIESGKIDIEKINFDPKKEINTTISLFLARCSEKNITLTLNIDENLPDTLVSDPFRIKQIVSNLISNAIKFTPNGKNIDINMTYQDGMLNITVQDEGIGISKDKLEHIFDAFTQEDSSTTRKYGGTGLGLAISSKLAELLGGALKVESKMDKGSTFYLTIPAKIGEKEDEREDKNLDSISFKGTKLLLCEDNRSNQLLMEILLKKLHINIDIANDGVEAVELFKKNSYDAILMDENMPNMSGIEATKKILEIEKEKNLKHTPIIALTANAIKGDRERFLEAGMDEYLTKPIDKNQLVEVLNIFL